MSKLYAERDARALGQDYLNHVMAMTAEGLHAKSDIAAELAFRDVRIRELEDQARESAHKANTDIAALEQKLLVAVTERNAASHLAMDAEAALAWLECKAREGKIEIAPSLYGSGFEFGFWPKCEAKAVPAKTLLEAIHAAGEKS